MCVSCGCHEYTDDHGDKNNIVLDEVKQVGGPEQVSPDRFQKAADAANISLDAARENTQKDYAAATETP